MDSFDYLLDNLSLVMRKENDSVFIIYCFGKPYIKLVNCENISFAFIKEIFQNEREQFLESFETKEYEEINMQAKVREWIRDGLWDWEEEANNKEVEIGSLITGFEDVIKVK